MNQLTNILALTGGFAALTFGAMQDEKQADKKQTVPQFDRPVQMMADGKKIRVEAPGYAAPCWHDVDGDGQKDLVVGQFNDGKLNFYRNAGDLILEAGVMLQAGGKPASVPGVW